MSQAHQQIVVTGGAGFIGSHLVRALMKRGHSVTVFDNLSVGRADNVPLGARLVVGDVLDVEAAQSVLGGCDTLVHLAARVAIRSSYEFAVEDTRVNVVGTATILRAASLVGTVKRVVAASSMAVYADAPDTTPISESHPTQPISPYGISKLALEQLTHGMARAAGMHSVVLRLFNTYGPGQALSPYVGVTTNFIHKLLRGDRPIVFGDGEQCRDFVHVADVTDALVRAAEATLSGATLNIGTGQATSVNTLLATLQHTLGTRLSAQHAPPARGELRYSIADIANARRLLGYSPQMQMNTALPHVVQEIVAASKA